MIPYIQIPIKTSKKQLMQKTVNKYIFFSWTLEWLAKFYFFQDKNEIDLRIIEENIYKSGLLSEKEASRNDISHWLQEMQAMKLIKLIKIIDTNTDEIALEKDGYEAYRNQTFQSMATSLLEANENKKMARWAVIVAVVSIILTLISFIIK